MAHGTCCQCSLGIAYPTANEVSHIVDIMIACGSVTIFIRTLYQLEGHLSSRLQLKEEVECGITLALLTAYFSENSLNYFSNH